MLVATNGLRVKPMVNRKMVMDAEDAARLCAGLRPRVVMPFHYVFEARSWFYDSFLISYAKGPERFVEACRRMCPGIDVVVAPPGYTVEVQAAAG